MSLLRYVVLKYALLATVLSSTLLCFSCSYSDSGDGSGTLKVDALTLYDVASSSTTFQVDIEKAGAPVSGATVTFTDDETGKVYILTADLGGALGRYLLTDMSGYHRSVALSVKSDSDFVSAQLEGPGSHIISAPEHNSTTPFADFKESIFVRWKTKDGIRAENVRVEIGGLAQAVSSEVCIFAVHEGGKASLDPSGCIAVGGNYVDVYRSNTVTLAGAVQPSNFRVEYHARNSFVLE